MIKLLGRIKNKVTKDKIEENVSHSEITEVLIACCNIVNNDYEHDLKGWYTFDPNQSFGQ